MTGEQIKNGEPEGVYAQVVPGVVCFQLEDVQQEVQTRFGSKSGKIQPFKLGKRNKWKPTKQKLKHLFCWNHRQIEKALWHFDSHVWHERNTCDRIWCTQVKQGKECTSAWRPACNLTPVASYITCQ